MQLVFDRGTILLEGAPADVEIAQLPGVQWDERVAAFRAPARFRTAIGRRLAELGVRFSDTVRPDSGTPDGSWSPPPLRLYQRQALEAWTSAGRRGLISLPTGAGKTRIAVAAAAACQVRTLCLAPTRVLLGQWRDTLATFFSGAVGVLGDGEHRVLPVTVATFEGAWRHMDRLGDLFELLIVDEAHHFGAGSRVEALEMCGAPWRLGLTAVPPGDPEGRARLAELVGPTVFQLSIADLKGRWLADFERITLKLDLTPSERADYEDAYGRFLSFMRAQGRVPPDLPWKKLVLLARESREGREALDGWRRAREILTFTEAKRQALDELLRRHRGEPVLIFTGDNRTAYRIARHHLVMPITCDVSRKERTQALADFRSGALRVLVSAQVLNEGLDVPEARVGIVVAGRFGEREHLQRVGRLLRPRPGKEALVYELVTRGSMEVRQAERRGQGLATTIAP